MELSIELLQSTLRALKSDPMEQRRHPRAPVRAKVKIVPYKNGVLSKPIEVWTRDISTGGLGVISTAPIAVGGKFVLRLPRADGTPTYLICTVKNCFVQAKSVYVIGCTFTEPSNHDHSEFATETEPVDHLVTDAPAETWLVE